MATWSFNYKSGPAKWTTYLNYNIFDETPSCVYCFINYRSLERQQNIITIKLLSYHQTSDEKLFFFIL